MAPLPRVSATDCGFLALQHARGAERVACGMLLLMEGEPPSLDRLTEQVRGRVARFAGLTWTVSDDRPRLVRPRWRPAEDVDVTRLVFEAVTSPAAPTLHDLAGLCMRHPPTGAGVPLWSLGLLRRAGPGEWALLFRAHHGAYDGTSVLRALRWLLAPEPPAVAGGGQAPARGEPGSALPRALRGLTSMGVRLVRDRAPQVPALSAPADEPCRVGWTHTPVTTLRNIARKHDVTGNVVFLAALTMALRGHLLARGSAVPASLMAAVPMATPGADPGVPVGNSIACARFRLPLHLSDAGACLRYLADASAHAKRARHREGGQAAAWLARALPAPWTRLLPEAAVHPRWNNLVATNVGSTEVPLRCAGARVRAIVALTVRPPTGGLAASVITHEGTTTAGFLVAHRVDPGLDLPRHYARALRELLG